MAAHRAIVVGIDTPIGLTVVRELGQHGVQVYGLAQSRSAVGLYSRYLEGGYIREREEERRVEQINTIARTTGAKFLLAVSEGDILFLNRNAERLEVRLLVPDARPMALVLNKAETYARARTIDLDVPIAHSIEDAGMIEPLLGRVEYPVILKWADPGSVRSRLRKANRPLLKAEYCHTPGELRTALERYAPVGVFPMIQSFCPGVGLGHMIFMYEGRPLLRFQHRRLHEWPPEGGVSTMCESVSWEQHSELMDKSVALLRSMEWQGPAMVEYRYDPRTDRAVLMEVNGRFWGSLPLAHHAGACFAWYTYSVLGLGRILEHRPYRPGLRCRFMVPETRRLLRILFRPGSIQDRRLRFGRLAESLGYVVDFVRPRTHYYVFKWSDPCPFIADMWAVLRKAITRSDTA